MQKRGSYIVVSNICIGKIYNRHKFLWQNYYALLL